MQKAFQAPQADILKEYEHVTQNIHIIKVSLNSKDTHLDQSGANWWTHPAEERNPPNQLSTFFILYKEHHFLNSFQVIVAEIIIEQNFWKNTYVPCRFLSYQAIQFDQEIEKLRAMRFWTVTIINLRK